jgi:S1-C subfamily serine protease
VRAGRPTRRTLAALVAAAALSAAGGPAGAEDEAPPASWAWLAAANPRPDAVRMAPTLTDEEGVAGLSAWRRHAAVLASSPEGRTPTDGAAEAAAVVVTADGVLATSWRAARAVARAREVRWLWARLADGPWMRAVPVGGTWTADVVLLRLVTSRRPRPFEPVEWGRVDRALLGRRVLCVGAALGHGNVVAASAVSSIDWFDPASATGLVETKRGAGGRGPASKDSRPVEVHAGEELSARGGLGSGVFSSDGRCLGLVTAPDPSRPEAERTSVRPADLLRPLVARLLAEAAFAPPDPGFVLGPLPRPLGTRPRPPLDLERAREAGVRGGALVVTVADQGPALGVVWPGDVVLSVAGKPVSAEAPEALPDALYALVVGVPADVVLWRGGKRVSVQVVPRPARDADPDPQAAHDRSGDSLLE